MTVLLTAPERLKIMAKDADTRIQYSTDTFQKTLDSVQTPAALIEIGESDYPPLAASVEHPNEVYKMLLVSGKLGQGADTELETLNRELADIIHLYFLKRTQLQFSNLRDLEANSLPPLQGVLWARTNRSNGPTLLERENYGPFWGCEFTVAIKAITNVSEQLY